MYQLTKTGLAVIREADGACIPLDNGNRDYQEYLRWIEEGGVPAPAQTEEELIAEDRRLRKEAREKKVERIVVEVAGLKFDGDETSQNRMARTIVAMQTSGTVTLPWTLADNTVAVVTQTQLSEALLRAGMEQSSMWAL